MRRAWWVAILALVPAVTGARSREPAGLTVERVVVVMRHGVRPPTKDPAMPAGVAAWPWPRWPVPAGWLTPHGAAGVRLIAAADRTGFVAARLLPATGCPAAGQVRIVADSDQRTIATAEAYRAALAPGCTLTIEHRPQGERDPLFSPTAAEAPLDAGQARAAILAAAGLGGLAGLDARERPLLSRLDAILCGGADRCGVSRQPTGVTVNDEGRAKLNGALDRASTAAQILLLEYAEGKPLAEVGWGRATPGDIARLSRFHALEFALAARPLPLARRHLTGLAPLIRDALTARAGPAVTLISGHDTDVAALAGVLDAHWHVPGLAADDPAPGGALILERVVDRGGRRFVRATYRSLTLEQLRSLAPGRPVHEAIAIDACREHRRRLCPLDEAATLIAPAAPAPR